MTVAVDLDYPLPAPDPTDSRLTAHEQRVLALAASGWRTAAVAAALELSPEAVDRSLRSILAKVGARSKIEAVLIAVREGLINLPTNGEDVHRVSAVRPVMRLRRWGADDRREKGEPLRFMDKNRREIHGHRVRTADADGAAT